MHIAKHKVPGFVDRSPMGVAKRQGLSCGTVYKELREGRLRGKKLGSRTIISEQAEQDWLNNLPNYPT